MTLAAPVVVAVCMTSALLLLLACTAGAAAAAGTASSRAGRSFTVVEGFNAVPRGWKVSASSLQECMDVCDQQACLQFSFNELFHVCYHSNLTSWAGLVNDHIISGCIDSAVARCGDVPSPPEPSPKQLKWAVSGAPNTSDPACGFPTLSPALAPVGRIYHATPEIGMYNHAAMIDFFDSNFFVSWKNSPLHEDTPGQRILYSQSTDGLSWTPTDGRNVLFPNMSSNSNPAALFAGPTVILNGRRYATASPHQFCLFPYPYVGEGYVLLLRRVGNTIPAKLGPIFWANPTVPFGFEEATKRNGVLTSAQMDAETQADLALLDNWNHLPCGNTNGSASLKCEMCLNGCDDFLRRDNVDDGRADGSAATSAAASAAASAAGGGGRGGGHRHDGGRRGGGGGGGGGGFAGSRGRLGSLGGSSEETHYTVPHSSAGVILHRTGNNLAFTYRPNTTVQWSIPWISELPDAGSNLNAGTLPDGRVFLASNPCPHRRYPLVISTTRDGFTWDKAVGVLSCEQLRNTSFCAQGATPSLAYPQAVAVTAPADVAGLYVVVSVNNSVRVPYTAL
ncbi:hypothetical protein PTSG_06984 [Salpingoeca rosetta]|uniref:Apple domain-containing protein n=1 Tax=Salpingoeca rosetta (strain ATCC 50818 / BSB-021) TaxID=946362 RepID=F2UFD5_SALR5|nr:uncharacterized protein PTSG_06984 [Salpingoeca rosetta]EGD75335.1 hypothetical protein PTSG_06984 [Salpingoeca rosetta]|eukprot:XP_004992388.1 hypothetical protein PTSG_06984 [Salpingoeca rosetta]